MKKTILLALAVFGLASNAQTPGLVTQGAGYANQVYYKFSSNSTTATVPAASWDIAFLRTSAFAISVRVNDSRIQTYEVGATSVWSTVDVAQEANWTRLYNSDVEWETGSFDTGSATYGWGEYNPVTHHVVGSKVFVLKTGSGATAAYKKIKIDDFFGGYTFTYSSWDGSAWSADTTQTVANSLNTDRFFNYFSLTTNAVVEVEPANTNWDLLFTQYVTDYTGGVDNKYKVTGVLTHPDIQVAQHEQPDGLPANFTPTFGEQINVIGFDWKTLNGNFQYDVDSDQAFFVKLANGTVYRLTFDTFVGSSTGVTTFNQQDVTSQLSSEEFENRVSFGIYPNPSVDKKISVLYDGAQADAKNSVSIFSLTGAKVYETNLDNNGFANAELNLSNLNAGVYILKFQSGDYAATRKIVLQ
ncbi:T9SS type A sorting domain-containing protein [Flavobacterium sp. MAH-1]|uniref:T9SS type A sorting domain-containing protein n=1 Tax=Flavobacterium agri TaxID=2743471 RepID=A0A7Y9C5X2_9FLAO|nr:T9SS type A sorting domain-containing protein [Flavobacterium agri]NUY80855.1 T9SS type A sorting domain-containing protein [Flavobacterium agri]NYA70879.1 T9SS type A sorting domain-containing protein [Flavobacterium agri]